MGLAALLAGACNPAADTSSCYVGDYQNCTCDGAEGYQKCDDHGTFGECDCTETPGSDAGPPMGSGGADGGTGGGTGVDDAGLLPFMAPCETNAQCESMICFPYNAKGPHCTIPCTAATVCPPPSDGCSGMGVCKAP